VARYEPGDFIEGKLFDPKSLREIIARPAGDDCESTESVAGKDGACDAGVRSVPTYCNDRLGALFNRKRRQPLFIAGEARFLELGDAQCSECGAKFWNPRTSRSAARGGIDYHICLIAQRVSKPVSYVQHPELHSIQLPCSAPISPRTIALILVKSWRNGVTENNDAAITPEFA
jgi:hypothetical protein